ncbi:CHAT domain-containing protein [Aquimarina algiphila]|uniref:CHAT domain-containing protein n=1 Tax=Aquimarina algiphila TaxID=2047982 RepID=UPI00249334B7|nr:CHAT domain-containing tetratricopeptide repeat protein [Aquimarina algiphila]
MKTVHSIVLVSILFIIACHTTYAQIEKDTIVASQYYQKADSLLTEREYDSSIEYFTKALPIYQKAKAWEKVASCYNKISENQWRNEKLEKSLSNAKKAIEISDRYLKKDNEEAYAYDNIGEYYYKASEYNKALENYEKSLQTKLKMLPKNHLHITESYTKLGNIYNEYGDFDRALKYFKNGLEINQNIFGEEHEKTANSYNNIGVMLQKKGKYDMALQFQDKALAVRMDLFGKNHPTIAKSYNNIGNIYIEIETYDKALKYYKKAIAINQNVFGINHPRLIASYHNVGIAYHKVKMFDKAIQFYTKGLNIILNRFGENHLFTAHSYNNFGKAYEELKNYSIALDYFIKSQNIYKNKLGENNVIISRAYNYTALAYAKNKEYNKALEHYKKAILSNSNQNGVVNDYQNFGHFLDLNRLLISLEGKARVLKALYEERNNTKDLEESIKAYRKANRIMNAIRQSLSNRKDKVTFAKTAKKVYQGAIEAQLLLYAYQKNQQSLKSAFDYAEKSKGNTLKELLNDANAKDFSGLPMNVLELEKEHRIDHAFYQSRINKEQSSKKQDSAKIKEYENKLFDINRRQDSLTQVLEKNYPKYHQLKYQNDIVTVADIQQQLDNKTTVLEFFTGDSISYAFTISKNNIAVQKLATPKLTEQVEDFRKSIIDQDVKSYKKQASALYNKLINPIADQLVGDQLIIVPDGPLWHLNFDVLLTKQDDSNNPALLSYLLKDYAITYANSANLLFAPFKENLESKVLQDCLAFSFSDSTQTGETRAISMETLRGVGGDLPGTRKEIKAISDIIDGQYYYGSQAVEANFKKNAGQYNILHLALHGEVDNERPENSRLYFTKNKDTIEDNLLYSHELFALDIPAELTVLSACNTGTGKIAKGEGIMSLGNAFQYAGTKSLLLTNWEVSDKTTPEVMKYFYRNLKEGMNKGKALQQAKLQYIAAADINRTAPFYWGAFYLVGDAAPMHFENNSVLYWILGLGILAILLLSIMWYRRKKKS